MSYTLNSPFDNLKPSPTLHINESVARLWAAGETVYHLGFGESRFPVHPLMKKALADNTHHKSYPPSQGMPDLCQAVATYYSNQLNLPFADHQVIIGPGSKALIYALQMALDADLYLPSPSWVSYEPQAAMLGKRVTYIPSRVADHYTLNLAAFESALDPTPGRQKLLILTTPNNPAGYMLAPEFLEELAEFCRNHNILVISDEIYFRIHGREHQHDTLARHYPEGTFVLGGLSKHLSIGGWRLGVALLPDSPAGQQLMGAVKAIASETWSGVAAPIQQAALTAYSGNAEIETYIETCSDIHGLRTRELARRLEKLGITCTPPVGAFYITANFDAWRDSLGKIGVNSSTDLALHLLDEYRIASLPGDAFGLPKDVLSLRLASSYLDMETDSAAQAIVDLYHPTIDSKEFLNATNHPRLHECVAAFAAFIETHTP